MTINKEIKKKEEKREEYNSEIVGKLWIYSKVIKRDVANGNKKGEGEEYIIIEIEGKLKIYSKSRYMICLHI